MCVCMFTLFFLMPQPEVQAWDWEHCIMENELVTELEPQKSPFSLKLRQEGTSAEQNHTVLVHAFAGGVCAEDVHHNASPGFFGLPSYHSPK